MNCVINTLIKKFSGQDKSPEVMARYIRMKYKILIDPETLRKREASIKHQYSFN